MEQNKKKFSQYDKFKRNFQNSVDKNEKAHKQKIILIAVGIFLLAIALILCAALIENSNKDMLVYYFGGTEQKIKDEGGLQLIDFVALADYCGMTKSVNSPNASFEINGTKASFISGSKIAKINGFDVEMPTEATIKNGYCLVPLSIVEQVFSGLTIMQSENETTITTNGKKILMVMKNIDPDYKTDITDYLEYIHSENEYIHILLNKQNPMEDDDFTPENLVTIPKKYSRDDKTLKLYRDAEKALEAMMQDMRFLEFNDVQAQSAYRDYAEQQKLFNNYVNTEMDKGLSREEAEEQANKYSALPQNSEHRTGLCVDFFIPSVMYELENYGHEGKYNDVGFAETETFTWLKENCWKYGFILRYPEDKVDITGYSYESWHYRFVGFEAASIIYQTGLCYEEYLENFAI